MLRSPPSRRRGLKSSMQPKDDIDKIVASFAEAWIEIGIPAILVKTLTVASFAEAWIEIFYPSFHIPSLTSPPSRRRGLKFKS